MKQDQQTSLPMVWSLSHLSHASSKDPLAQEEVARLKKTLIELYQDIETHSLKSSHVETLQKLAASIHEYSSYATCLFAENTHNTEAYLVQDLAKELQASLENLMHLMEVKLLQLSDSDFETFLKDKACQGISFYLREKRELVKAKLSLEFETMITDLSTDGYHGFSKMYETLLGTLNFKLNDEDLSISQIDNKLHSLSQEERQKAFDVYKQVFKTHEHLFAEILNHISGFRLKVYEKRKWDKFLQEPLTSNRMSQKTLDTMWNTIDHNIKPLCDYLKRKAELMKQPSLNWLDVDHPLSKTSTLTSYDEAATLIYDAFHQYSPKMAAFALKAMQQGWIEAEDRPGKYAGGFCISFPVHKESRIFMTYSGSQSSVSTLAHELGHAYHNEVIGKLPYFAQDIKMNVAETASTMAEMLLADGALTKAQDIKEKIALLDDKLSSAVAFLMNIRARFLFETAFYNERLKGYVGADKLSSLMLDAQKTAYHDLLGEWHPHFWASKIHFYFTDISFYNFPYTFGYLFSLGIYAKAKQSPARFEAMFDALLHDTALMSVEELAQKHLKVDLESSDFWQSAMNEVKQDAALFLELTKMV